MARAIPDDALVGIARVDMLSSLSQSLMRKRGELGRAYVTLLLEDVSNLEPDIGVREWVRRVAQYAIEAVERLRILALLFVDDPEAEQDLVCLIEIC